MNKRARQIEYFYKLSSRNIYSNMLRKKKRVIKIITEVMQLSGVYSGDDWTEAGNYKYHNVVTSFVIEGKIHRPELLNIKIKYINKSGDIDNDGLNKIKKLNNDINEIKESAPYEPGSIEFRYSFSNQDGNDESKKLISILRNMLGEP